MAVATANAVANNASARAQPTTSATANTPRAGRVPPSDVDAERAVLGAILLDSTALTDVLEMLHAEDFYHAPHPVIFQAIVTLNSSGTEVDLVTLSQQLRTEKQLTRVGGYAYIAALTETVVSGANALYFAETIRDLSTRRLLLHISGQLATETYDTTIACRDTIDKVETELFKISSAAISNRPQLVRDVAVETFTAIEHRATNKEDSHAVPTGFKGLDNLLGGLHPSEFIVIGARPSVGKTALTISMLAKIAVHDGRPCAFFSLEMTSMAIMQRLFSREARIGASKLRSGMLNHNELKTLRDAIDPIYESPLWIVDTPHLQMFDLRTLARRLISEHHIQVIFIDYLTLITADTLDLPRHEQVASISRSLKAMAHELGVPVVVLSQVTRETEGRKPTLATIRESGSIEQDADVVLFLHRENEEGNEQYNTETGDPSSALTIKVIVAKQRNGPVGAVDLRFIPEYVSFEEPAREDYL